MLLRIDVGGALERFLNAENEYFLAGGIQAVERALQVEREISRQIDNIPETKSWQLVASARVQN